ncbi:MAG: hypothetical protein LBD59_01980 [Prevotellaceae bacterium]|nr:hypothetical protein [Prevotellaceae bacterium]
MNKDKKTGEKAGQKPVNGAVYLSHYLDNKKKIEDIEKKLLLLRKI